MNCAKKTNEYNKIVSLDIQRIKEDINSIVQNSRPQQDRNRLDGLQKCHPQSCFDKPSPSPDIGQVSTHKSSRDQHHQFCKRKTSAQEPSLKQYSNDSILGIYNDGKI